MPVGDADLIARIIKTSEMTRLDLLELLGANKFDDADGEWTMSRLHAAIRQNRQNGLAAAG